MILEKEASSNFEIIFVDDGSDDNTSEIVESIAQKDSHVKLIQLFRDFGHQNALTAGMAHASGDIIITMDSDLQHPPEVIKEMLAKYNEGNDVIYTVRRGSQKGALKNIMSYFYYTSYFYWNSVSGTFTSNAFDVLSPWNVAVADYDRDGRLDLYFSYVSLVPNRLYRNLGDLTFQRKHVSVVGPVARDYTFGGAAWADYDDDGWPDLCAPDFKNSRIRMYHNERTGRFAAVNNPVTGSGVAIACAWGECDNDGRLDLFVAGGSGESRLYLNGGVGTFTTGSLRFSGFCNGASWADYDDDGFLDLFVSLTLLLYASFPPSVTLLWVLVCSDEIWRIV